MIFSATDFRLIITALRYTSMAMEECAKISLQGGNRRDAFTQGGLAQACGDLSDRLARETKAAPAPTIFKPS